MRIFLITDIHHGQHTNYADLGGEEYINSFGDALEKNRGFAENNGENQPNCRFGIVTVSEKKVEVGSVT